MKHFVFFVSIIGGFFLIQGCSSALQHATTVERDKKNGCTVNIILHIGVEGTQADVDAVQAQLQDCFGKTCTIPCGGDSTKGCLAVTTVEVKSWSSLKREEQKAFHHITMVDNDGKPSCVYGLGSNGGSSRNGTWRRNEPPRTYCHEVLHLAGLEDQYCDRTYISVFGIMDFVRQARNCNPGPNPDNGNCCTPTPQSPRCTASCPGHEDDLMANLESMFTCDRILEVVAKAGLNDCPEKCCGPVSHAVAPVPVHRAAVNHVDSLMPQHSSIVPQQPLHVGVTLFTGYSGIYTYDNISKEKQPFSGFNVGIAAGVQYQTCDKWSVEGRLRAFEFSQVMNKQTTGGLTTESNYRFEQLGLDAHAYFNFYDHLSVFGGPTVSFNLMTTDQFKYTSGLFNSNTGWNTLHNHTSIAVAGFDVGFMYQVPVSGMNVQPFIFSRLPLSNIFDHFSNYQSYPFTLDVGATFNFFNK